MVRGKRASRSKLCALSVQPDDNIFPTGCISSVTVYRALETTNSRQGGGGDIVENHTTGRCKMRCKSQKFCKNGNNTARSFRFPATSFEEQHTS